MLQLSEKASCAVSEQCRLPRCVHNFALSSIQALWQTANCLVSMCQATWFTSLFECASPFLNALSVLYGLVWTYCIGKNCHGRKLEILMYRQTGRIGPVCAWVIWCTSSAQKLTYSLIFCFLNMDEMIDWRINQNHLWVWLHKFNFLKEIWQVTLCFIHVLSSWNGVHKYCDNVYVCIVFQLLYVFIKKCLCKFVKESTEGMG